MGSQIFNWVTGQKMFGWSIHILAEWQDNQDLGNGFKVSYQGMTPLRWAVFGLSLTGVLLCFYVLLVNAGVEAALKTLNHSRLHGLQERHERRAKIIAQLLDRPAQVLSAITTLNVICLILIPALAISAIHQFSLYDFQELAPLIIILILLVLVLARAVPKGIATQRPEQMALRWSKFVNTETALMSPVVKLTNSLSNIILRRAGVAPLPANTVVTHEELTLLTREGEDEGIIHRDEREMIQSIFEFGDTIVREVMIPRLDIKSIPQSATLDETLDIILKNGHSRLPVYTEDLDHIIGILYAKDLLRFLRAHTDNTRFELARILRPPYYVPESKKVDILFQELQNRHVHIAIVIDEYGGTAGLVTIEDLLEEIVGEIQDEYDTETPQIERRSADEVVVDARLNLEEANELFNTNWQSENVDTIGGFVYDQLGRIPAPGDELVMDNVRISVQTLIGNRLKKLVLTRLHTDYEVSTDSNSNDANRGNTDQFVNSDAALLGLSVPTGPDLAAPEEENQLDVTKVDSEPANSLTAKAQDLADNVPSP